jgi:hypothetical protein
MHLPAYLPAYLPAGSGDDSLNANITQIIAAGAVPRFVQFLGLADRQAMQVSGRANGPHGGAAGAGVQGGGRPIRAPQLAFTALPG